MGKGITGFDEVVQMRDDLKVWMIYYLRPCGWAIWPLPMN